MIVNTLAVAIAWTAFGVVGLIYSLLNLGVALGDYRAQQALGTNGVLILVARASIDAEIARAIGLSACVLIGISALLLRSPPHRLTWVEAVFDVALFTIELSKVFNSWRIARLNREFRRIQRKKRLDER